jgi:hypothetical protein
LKYSLSQACPTSNYGAGIYERYRRGRAKPLRKTPEMVGKGKNVWFEKDRKIQQIKEQPK